MQARKKGADPLQAEYCQLAKVSSLLRLHPSTVNFCAESTKDLMSTALESIACAVAAAGSVFFWVVLDQIGERKIFARRAKVLS